MSDLPDNGKEVPGASYKLPSIAASTLSPKFIKSFKAIIDTPVKAFNPYGASSASTAKLDDSANPSMMASNSDTCKVVATEATVSDSPSKANIPDTEDSEMIDDDTSDGEWDNSFLDDTEDADDVAWDSMVTSISAPDEFIIARDTYQAIDISVPLNERPDLTRASALIRVPREMRRMIFRYLRPETYTLELAPLCPKYNAAMAYGGCNCTHCNGKATGVPEHLSKLTRYDGPAHFAMLLVNKQVSAEFKYECLNGNQMAFPFKIDNPTSLDRTQVIQRGTPMTELQFVNRKFVAGCPLLEESQEIQSADLHIFLSGHMLAVHSAWMWHVEVQMRPFCGQYTNYPTSAERNTPNFRNLKKLNIKLYVDEKSRRYKKYRTTYDESIECFKKRVLEMLRPAPHLEVTIAYDDKVFDPSHRFKTARGDLTASMDDMVSVYTEHMRAQDDLSGGFFSPPMPSAPPSPTKSPVPSSNAMF